MRKLLVTALMLVALFGAPTFAHAQARAGFYYTVQKSEPLSVIAGRFGMSEAELAKENRMARGAKLARGSRVWIPRKAIASAPVAASPRQVSTPTRPAATPKPAAASARPADFSPAPTPAPAASGSGLYTVRSGDTLWGVSSRFGLTVDELARMNGLSSRAQLEIGQKLSVIKSESDIPGGGVVPAPVTPSSEPLQNSAPTTGLGSTKPSSRGYIWPIEGRILRSYIDKEDEKYTGIDIAAPRGSEVRAAREGRVLYAGEGIPSYGKMVIVAHDGDIASCYAQLDRILVKKDQQVKRGQVIGRSGDLGRGREPYLHFEIRRGGSAVDPEPYLP